MAKETEKRLIRTLEFLKEPHGSTIPAIVKAMNGEGPQVSLKKIIQTLRGCLENGVLKVSDGRVKFKQINTEDEDEKTQIMNESGSSRDRSSNICGSSRRLCPSRLSDSKCMKMRNFELPATTYLNPDDTFNGYRCGSKICVADGDPPEAGGDGEGGDGDPNGMNMDKSKCRKPKPKCPKPKPKCPKPKPKCPKPKPKCPKPKPKCPKPKPKCPKPKPKCPKPKPKCPKPKPKCPKPKPKKCAKRKIQPYCKKKKKCEV